MTMPKHKKTKPQTKPQAKAHPKAKQLTATKRERIATQAKAAIDTALGPPAGTVAPKTRSKKQPPYPGAEELAGAVWDLKRVVNKQVQRIYDQVLSKTIIKLQHARRKTIV